MPYLKKSPDKEAARSRSGASSFRSLRLRVTGGAALIAAAIFLAYSPSINGGFILDDDKLLTENDIVRAPDGTQRFWLSTEAVDYWPLSNSTLWIEWRLWGMHPAGYRATNLILHAAEAFLIWALLRKLAIPGAFLAAMFFAVHPVNVEAAAWIAQRKDMLALLFFLLSILWYLKSIKLGPRPIFGPHPLEAKQPSFAQCPPHNSSSLILHPLIYGIG